MNEEPVAEFGFIPREIEDHSLWTVTVHLYRSPRMPADAETQWAGAISRSERSIGESVSQAFSHALMSSLNCCSEETWKGETLLYLPEIPAA